MINSNDSTLSIPAWFQEKQAEPEGDDETIVFDFRDVAQMNDFEEENEEMMLVSEEDDEAPGEVNADDDDDQDNVMDPQTRHGPSNHSKTFYTLSNNTVRLENSPVQAIMKAWNTLGCLIPELNQK